MTIKEVINGINAIDLMAFPQKNNPKRVTISIKSGTSRYFLTRRSTNELDERGRVKYEWTLGNQMRVIGTQPKNTETEDIEVS